MNMHIGKEQTISALFSDRFGDRGEQVEGTQRSDFSEVLFPSTTSTVIGFQRQVRVQTYLASATRASIQTLRTNRHATHE